LVGAHLSQLPSKALPVNFLPSDRLLTRLSWPTQANQKKGQLMLAKHAIAGLLLIFGTNVVAASSVVPTPDAGQKSLIVKIQKAGAASPAAGAGGQKGGVATPPKGQPTEPPKGGVADPPKSPKATK
jgi:hypothetical protein